MMCNKSNELIISQFVRKLKNNWGTNLNEKRRFPLNYVREYMYMTQANTNGQEKYQSRTVGIQMQFVLIEKWI